jgi:hypothetical protein
MGVGDKRHAPAALPPGKTRYPLYRGLGGPQGRSGRVQKISPPPEFDPRSRPARSESLNRLRPLPSPRHLKLVLFINFMLRIYVLYKSV